MIKFINYLSSISVISLIINIFYNENHNIISDDGYKKLENENNIF